MEEVNVTGLLKRSAGGQMRLLRLSNNECWVLLLWKLFGLKNRGSFAFILSGLCCFDAIFLWDTGFGFLVRFLFCGHFIVGTTVVVLVNEYSMHKFLTCLILVDWQISRTVALSRLLRFNFFGGLDLGFLEVFTVGEAEVVFRDFPPLDLDWIKIWPAASIGLDLVSSKFLSFHGYQSEFMEFLSSRNESNLSKGLPIDQSTDFRVVSVDISGNSISETRFLTGLVCLCLDFKVFWGLRIFFLDVEAFLQDLEEAAWGVIGNGCVFCKKLSSVCGFGLSSLPAESVFAPCLLPKLRKLSKS